MVSRSLSRRSRARGAHVVEYLVVVGALALVVASALVYVAGPNLVVTFRVRQRAAAAPMP